MVKPIPDRWLDYQPIGQRVPSTRFIAFKVPLRQNINETVDAEQRLAPQSLVESVPNLGLIVDLTNTNRYYNPQTFRDLNVEHQKLMIPGHQTPPKALAKRFCDYVTNFLDANADNDKLIGVHCTHGVNRTGYLICYFMITKMNMAPKLAMQTFADARGHQIERDNYTSSLLQLLAQEQKQEPVKTIQDWPRQFHKTKDDLYDEREPTSWRHDQNSWQQHLQRDQLQRQRREQKQQQRGYQSEQAGRHQNQCQGGYYERRGRQQQEQPPQLQKSWRGNEARRYEPYNRNNSYYNNSLNEKQANSRTMRPRPHWQRDPNDREYGNSQSYRRHNNNSDNNNYNDRSYGRTNNYRPYKNYNRPNHIRFTDDSLRLPSSFTN